MTETERRGSPRVHRFFDVHCLAPDGSREQIQATDLSATGCHLNSIVSNMPSTTVPHSQCRLLIFLGGEGSVAVDAEVVYAHRYRGIGVRFLNLPEAALSAIDRTVAAHRES